jgi:hypothetical protein
MDENKREKLVEIGYKLQPCCGTCAHSVILGASMFGSCIEHEYEHLKHTDRWRGMSVSRYGHCDHFVFNVDLEGQFGKFLEFKK